MSWSARGYIFYHWIHAPSFFGSIGNGFVSLYNKHNIDQCNEPVATPLVGVPYSFHLFMCISMNTGHPQGVSLLMVSAPAPHPGSRSPTRSLWQLSGFRRKRDR